MVLEDIINGNVVVEWVHVKATPFKEIPYDIRKKQNMQRRMSIDYTRERRRPPVVIVCIKLCCDDFLELHCDEGCLKVGGGGLQNMFFFEHIHTYKEEYIVRGW